MPEKPYDHNQIELKWHARWENADFYKAEARNSAYAAVDQIRFEVAQFRRDIAAKALK